MVLTASELGSYINKAMFKEDQAGSFVYVRLEEEGGKLVNKYRHVMISFRGSSGNGEENMCKQHPVKQKMH